MAFLEVKNLKKSFGRTEVLRGVDLSLEKGEVLSIIGSSGGGKTTLLRCLNFLEKADEGEITVNGKQVFYATPGIKPTVDTEAQLSFGLVFQQFNLFPQYNVIDNLMLAPKLRAKRNRKKQKRKAKNVKKIRARAEAILETVEKIQAQGEAPVETAEEIQAQGEPPVETVEEIRARAEAILETVEKIRAQGEVPVKTVEKIRARAEDILETVKKIQAQGEAQVETVEEIRARAEAILETVGLSEKANAYPCELSGGQQQRVAIARALMLSPDILCFDEPTSALDPELTDEVLRVIRSLTSSDRTMIIVTHEMEFARNVSDKVIFVADGIIEEEGTPEEVLVNPKSEKARAFLSIVN